MRLIQLSSSPAPVTLFDVKDHLRIEYASAADDDVLEALIPAAVDWAQNETRSQFSTATYRLYLDKFPDDGEVKLSRPPLQSVQSVRYVWTGLEQTLEPAAYSVDPSGSRPGRVTLNPGQSWPATDDVPNSVRVDFTAGYGVVPKVLRTALLMLVGHWHEHRESVSDRRLEETPMAVQSIVNQYAFPEVV